MYLRKVYLNFLNYKNSSHIKLNFNFLTQKKTTYLQLHLQVSQYVIEPLLNSSFALSEKIQLRFCEVLQKYRLKFWHFYWSVKKNVSNQLFALISRSYRKNPFSYGSTILLPDISNSPLNHLHIQKTWVAPSRVLLFNIPKLIWCTPECRHRSFFIGCLVYKPPWNLITSTSTPETMEKFLAYQKVLS